MRKIAPESAAYHGATLHTAHLPNCTPHCTPPLPPAAACTSLHLTALHCTFALPLHVRKRGGIAAWRQRHIGYQQKASYISSVGIAMAALASIFMSQAAKRRVAYGMAALAMTRMYRWQRRRLAAIENHQKTGA